MAVVLRVDGQRWRAHLARTIAAHPGLVPVVKGNGYGFGLELLVAECARLHGSAGVDMLAVGTYSEAPVALAGFPGDVLVLEPYRPVLHREADKLASPSLVHTIASLDDLVDLTERVARPRVVLEGLTSMNRHGMPWEGLREGLAAIAGPGSTEDGATRPAGVDLGSVDLGSVDLGSVDLGSVDLVGVTLHLPLGAGHLAEVERWLARVDVPTWFGSHLSSDELAELRRRHPERAFRPRIGTSLWLGDADALSVRGQVLDVRPVRAGDRAGYRRRRLKGGHLVVVSGGTAQGVAMEAPTAASTPRQRVIAVAEGVLEAAGRVRSPFSLGGRGTWFVEPPHMQVSLISLPHGAVPPQVGDEVEVRVRHTTLHADAVVIS